MVVIETSVAECVNHVRAEYLDMPGLSLTMLQMCRLWLIDVRTCEAVVNALVQSGFLQRRANGTYALANNRG